MSSSIDKLSVNTKGSIYFTTSLSHELGANKSDILNQAKAKNIIEVVLIDNHQTYDSSHISANKKLFGSNQVHVTPFVVLDEAPTEELKEDYESHGPRNLVKLVNYIFQKVVKGENILIDVNHNSECGNLIIAALAKKALSCLDPNEVEFAREQKPLSKIHQETVEQMDFDIEHQKWENPIHIPLNMKGAIYRGIMPRDVLFDEGAALQSWKDSNVQTIVCLCEKNELEVGTSTDLISIYKEEGFDVVHFPIVDYSIPEEKALRKLVNQLKSMSEEGKNFVVHCWGGNGRTGLVLSCLTKTLQKVAGAEAVAFIRQFIPKAVESESQHTFLETFYSSE